MYGYVYKTTNLINNKIYIGQKKGSFNPNYFGSGTLIRRALLKYGTDNFKLEVLACVEDKQKLDAGEIKYIQMYRQLFPREEMYNISSGGAWGMGDYWRGKHRSEETKGKIRQYQIGKTKYIMTDSIRRKISNSLKGHTPWNKGKHPEYVQGKNHPMFGRKSTPWKSKKHQSDGSNEKNRLAHLGKKHASETKIKMSSSAKSGWIKRRKKNSN